MKTSRIFLFTLFFILTAIFANAQTPAEAEVQVQQEKQAAFVKAHIEKVSNDVLKLKLPENRALAYSQLGNLYYKTDQARARQFFQTAIDNLLAAQKEASIGENPELGRDMLFFSSTRLTMLRAITACDVDLAFDLLEKSRPDVVKKALQGEAPSPDFFEKLTFRSAKSLIQTEIGVEENLALLVANKNPEIVAGILRRKTPFELAANTYSLWKTLEINDKQTADAILQEIIDKILAADLKANTIDVSFAGRILSEAGNNPNADFSGIKIEKIRKFAAKLADYLIEQANITGQSIYDPLLTAALIKILPQRADEIKAHDYSRFIPRDVMMPVISTAAEKEVAELIKREINGEQLLSAADKFPPVWRNQIYERAYFLLVTMADETTTREILKKFPPQFQTQKLSQLNLKLAGYNASKGDYLKSLSYIEQATPQANPQIIFNHLINLITAINKNPSKDKETALIVLEKVRKMVPAVPVNRTDFAQFGDLANNYVILKPETGFRMLEIALKRYVEINEAALIVDTYRQTIRSRKGELSLTSFYDGLNDFKIPLRNFARADAEKTLQTINKIKRSDLRIPLEIEVLKAALAP